MTTRAQIGARMGEALAVGPAPTGRPTYDDGVAALVFERELTSDPAQVWRLVTDPACAASWLGRWDVDAAAGTIDFWGLAEDPGAEPVRYHLGRVLPRRRLELVTAPQAGADTWRIRLRLSPGHRGGTALHLLETVPDPAFAPLVGAVAEFYLDRLTAVERGEDPRRIPLDDYVAGQARHYRDLFPAQRRSAAMAGARRG